MILDDYSRRLAFLLRHDKEGFMAGKIDGFGWREVRELCSSEGFTEDILEEIVKTDAKGRYEFSPDHTKIRAVQGHSIPVDVDLTEFQPPDILYHGTSSRFLESIQESGLKKGTRLYVHLSKDRDTAMNVGMRHGGQPAILEINTGRMYKDGIKFFQSKNGVWLVDNVPSKYIKSYEIITIN